jgi:Flp pilus assembly protein TadG
MKPVSMLRQCVARRHAGHSGQRGQALVEFTMMFVFIMLLLAGVADIGGLLDIHIAMVYAARQGARTGAVIGKGTGPALLANPLAADCAIVGAVHSVVANQPNLTVSLITIYQVGATGLVTGNAQYYPGTSDCQGGQIVNIDPVTLLSSPQSPLPGSTWDPSARLNAPYTEDSIGVKVDYTYQFQFNLLGAGPFSTSDYAVYPINPQSGS